eukprot:4520737-Heterocapsa_arctica.AAC.1
MKTELGALADTIKMVNVIDVLDVFKKTLPGASADDALNIFKKTLPRAAASPLQVKKECAFVRGRALNDISAVKNILSKKNGADLEFIALALSGEISEMIDEMVALLTTEQ